MAGDLPAWAGAIAAVGSIYTMFFGRSGKSANREISGACRFAAGIVLGVHAYMHQAGNTPSLINPLVTGVMLCITGPLWAASGAYARQWLGWDQTQTSGTLSAIKKDPAKTSATLGLVSAVMMLGEGYLQGNITWVNSAIIRIAACLFLRKAGSLNLRNDGSCQPP